MEHTTKHNMATHPHVAGTDGTGFSQVHPHYMIFNAICTDAAGTMYRGKCVVDDRIVAIKQFSEETTPALVEPQDTVLHLENLIGVTEVLSGYNGLPFSVMEMPGGACLEKLLLKRKKLPVPAAVNIALNVALVVRAIHVHNGVHGHVNAQNVFLKKQPNGRIGVQLLYHKLVGRPARCNLSKYLSPELISDNDVLMPSDDNWAVGVLLYEMIFGVAPFSGNIREQTTHRILTEELLIPVAFEQQYGDLTGFMRQTLSRDMDVRPSGREMNLMLKSILATLRNKPVSLAPRQVVATIPPRNVAGYSGGAGDDIEAFGTSLVEVPRSVPAESFVDEEFRDTRPEPVIPEADAMPSEPPTAQQAQKVPVYSPFSNDDLKDTAPGVCTMTDMDETPVSGYSPIAADDIMEVPIENLITPDSPDGFYPRDENAIVLAEIEELRRAYPRLESVHLIHADSLSTARAKRLRHLLAALVGTLVLGAILSVSIWFWVKSSDVAEKNATAQGDDILTEQSSNESVSRRIEGTPDNQLISAVDEEIGKASEQITVTLKGLPENAQVTINGMKRELPLKLPKSETPVALQAIVGNRIVFAETLIPTQSQTFFIAGSLEKSHKSNRIKKHANNKEESVSSKKAASGTLSSNPYRLRQNPFATGAQ